MSFKRVEDELIEDAMAIATYLRDLDEPSLWAVMRRVEALVGKDNMTREQALKQVDPRGDWGT